MTAPQSRHPATVARVPIPRRRFRRPNLLEGAMTAWAGLIALFLVAPLVIVVINSVGFEQYVIFPPNELSLRWYGQIPQYYIDGAILSVTLAFAAIGAASLLAIPAGLAIARGSLPGRSAIDALLRSPIQIPLLISGVAFLQFFVLVRGWTGIGLTNQFAGLWIAHTIVVSPYLLVAVVARLARYPDSLDDAAYGLGAGRVRTFFTITLPLIAPAIASGLFFAFLMSFDNVPTTIFLIQAGQTTLPLALFFDTELALSRVQYAVGTIVTLVSTAVILLAMRRFDLLPSVRSGQRAAG
jgi:putative spermidine/putrescine transport system permease protein